MKKGNRCNKITVAYIIVKVTREGVMIKIPLSSYIGQAIAVRQKDENDNDQGNTFFKSGVYT